MIASLFSSAVEMTAGEVHPERCINVLVNCFQYVCSTDSLESDNIFLNYNLKSQFYNFVLDSQLSYRYYQLIKPSHDLLDNLIAAKKVAKASFCVGVCILC